MGFFDRISEGLSRSRDKFKESMNVLLDRGPDLDEEFWEGLEETLILSDVGALAASSIVENLRDQATRKALPDAYAVLDMLNEQIASTFTEGGEEVFGGDPALVLFVGINGTGKTTTVGKLAKEASDAGRNVILGSAEPPRSSSSRSGLAAPMSKWSSVSGEAIPRACAMPRSSARRKRVRIWCSSTLQAACTRLPTSCASSRKS